MKMQPYSITIPFIFLFARLDTRSLMVNDNRSRIIDDIRSKPGIYFRKLSRELGLKQGVLSYHLNVLEKHELIKSTQDGNNRRFYLYDEKVVPKVTLSEIQENILKTIYDRPGISQSTISKELGKSKALVNYHMRILRSLGIVNVEKVSGVTQCYIQKVNLEATSS